MRRPFCTLLTASGIWVATALSSQAQSFDGSYIGVSLEVSGRSYCSPWAPAPRPLSITSNKARVLMGAHGDLVFEGTVDTLGNLTLRGAGDLMSGKVDRAGNAAASVASSYCTYSMKWRKQ